MPPRAYRIPVRSAQPGERRHEHDALAGRHALRQRGGLGAAGDDAEAVAQPLHRGPADEDAALEGVGPPAVPLQGDRTHEPGRRCRRLLAGVQQQEAAGAVGDLDHAPARARLAEEGGLLVAGHAGDGDGRPEQRRVRLADDAAAVHHLGQQRARHAEAARATHRPTRPRGCRRAASARRWWRRSRGRGRRSAATPSRSRRCRRRARRPRRARAHRARCRAASAAWCPRSKDRAAAPSCAGPAPRRRRHAVPRRTPRCAGPARRWPARPAPTWPGPTRSSSRAGWRCRCRRCRRRTRRPCRERPGQWRAAPARAARRPARPSPAAGY